MLFSQLTECLKYKKKNIKKTKPTGQKKLFIYELLFLTSLIDKIKNKNIIILYIGSAPGNHISFLIDIFFEFKFEWHLYDSYKHCDSLNYKSFNKSNKIKIFNKYFDKEDYINYVDKNVILISDIRTTDNKKEPSSKNLLSDYKLQNNILQNINPLYASLKYRCLFPSSFHSFSKPSGIEFLQIFTQKDSAELRIFTSKPYIFKEVNIEEAIEYEEKMFYYNTFIRNYNYDNKIKNILLDYIFKILKNNNIDKTKEINNILYSL